MSKQLQTRSLYQLSYVHFEENMNFFYLLKIIIVLNENKTAMSLPYCYRVWASNIKSVIITGGGVVMWMPKEYCHSLEIYYSLDILENYFSINYSHQIIFNKIC